MPRGSHRRPQHPDPGRVSLFDHGGAGLGIADPGREQQRRPAALSRTTAGEPAPESTEWDQRLVVNLSTDGRRSATEPAQDLGVSVNTVRRRLDRPLGSGAMAVRLDPARSVSGNEIAATFWLDVPPLDMDTVGRAIAELSECRRVPAVTGPQNPAVTARLRNAGDVLEFEQEMSRRAAARVVDRSVTLRVVEHAGRLLGPDGRATGAIPLEVWAGHD